MAAEKRQRRARKWIFRVRERRQLGKQFRRNERRTMAASQLGQATECVRVELTGLTGALSSLWIDDGRVRTGRAGGGVGVVRIEVPAGVAAVAGAVAVADGRLTGVSPGSNSGGGSPNGRSADDAVSTSDSPDRESNDALMEFSRRAAAAGATTVIALVGADAASASHEDGSILPLVASRDDPLVFRPPPSSPLPHALALRLPADPLLPWSLSLDQPSPDSYALAHEPIVSPDLLRSGALIAAGGVHASSADIFGIAAAMFRRESLTSASTSNHPSPSLDGNTLLRRVTSDAARAFGLHDHGRIEDGAVAHIVLVKTRLHPQFNDMASSLLSTWSPSHDIIAVFKRGKLVHASNEFAQLFKSAQLQRYYSFDNLPSFGDSSHAVDLQRFDAHRVRDGASNDSLNYRFDSIENALEEFRQGKFLVVVDNEDRENEGDLVIAGEDLTADKAAFMIRYTSGVICAPATAEILDRLDLPLMVTNNTDSLRTAYTVSTDLRHGTTTGISASDRSLTIRALASPKSLATDFSRPGHVFPLRAVPGGVLKRVGHTEASVDLCLLAGKHPVAAICEIVLDDGRMARRNDLCAFASRFGLSIITIHDLVQYRLSRGV